MRRLSARHTWAFPRWKKEQRLAGWLAGPRHGFLRAIWRRDRPRRQPAELSQPPPQAGSAGLGNKQSTSCKVSAGLLHTAELEVAERFVFLSRLNDGAASSQPGRRPEWKPASKASRPTSPARRLSNGGPLAYAPSISGARFAAFRRGRGAPGRPLSCTEIENDHHWLELANWIYRSSHRSLSLASLWRCLRLRLCLCRRQLDEPIPLSFVRRVARIGTREVTGKACGRRRFSRARLFLPAHRFSIFKFSHFVILARRTCQWSFCAISWAARSVCRLLAPVVRWWRTLSSSRKELR